MNMPTRDPRTMMAGIASALERLKHSWGASARRQNRRRQADLPGWLRQIERMTDRGSTYLTWHLAKRGADRTLSFESSCTPGHTDDHPLRAPTVWGS
jgi:hypothetical protein